MIQRNNGLEPRPAPCCVPVLRTGRNKEAKPGAGTGAGPPGQPLEAFAHQGVKGRVLGQPLARQSCAEPEGQNLAGLFSLAWHQSNACTLATWRRNEGAAAIATAAKRSAPMPAPRSFYVRGHTYLDSNRDGEACESLRR